jgi:hypothetical protein
MDSALAGLLGAVIGAGAGLAAAWLTSSLQARREKARWLLETRVKAYGSAIRHLYRAGYRMSKLSPEGVAFIGEAEVKEWFDDVTEALYQVVWLTIVCGDSQYATVQKAQADLDRAVAGVVSGHKPRAPKDLRYQLAMTYQAIHLAARADLGGAYSELSRIESLERLEGDAAT